jgi:hypothetical protein
MGSKRLLGSNVREHLRDLVEQRFHNEDTEESEDRATEFSQHVCLLPFQLGIALGKENTGKKPITLSILNKGQGSG